MFSMQLIIKKPPNQVLEVGLMDLGSEGMYFQFAFYRPF